jgi:ParB family chromosome partitioning protein
MHKHAAEMTHVHSDTLIINDEENNRLDFTVGLTELQSSIEEQGLLNPITVVQEDGKFRVVAGFRRAHAVQNLKMKQVPVMIREADGDQKLILQITENMQRENFNTFEMAQAIQSLSEDYKLSRDEIAKRLGRTPGSISHYLGLYDLPEEVQEMAKTGDLTVTHVRALHGMRKQLEGEKDMIKAAKTVQGMSQAKMDEYKKKLKARADYKAGEAEEEPAEKVATKAKEDEEQTVRSQFEIVSIMRQLNKVIKASTDGDDKTRMIGKLEALQWVLGSNHNLAA